MRSLKDLAIRQEAFKAKIAQRLAQLPPADEVLIPPDSRICEVCLGFGVVGYGAAIDDPNFGKVQPCTNPQCSVVRQRAQERAERVSGQIEAQYADYSFETWLDDVPHDKQAGKQLPLAVARHFARQPLSPFSISDVFDAMGKSHTYESFVNATGMDSLRVHLARTEDNVKETIQNTRGNWLVFEGVYGTGKTGLAVATRRELSARGYAVAFIRLPDFLRSYQDTYRMTDPTEQQHAQDRLVKPVQDADVLIIDEVNVAGGEERASEDKIRLFQDMIVNPRWLAAYRKPIVLTTNLTAQQFEAHWDSRLATRVFERAHWLRFLGDPIRHRNNPV
jgi:DNA replication protein DnaC